jgi:hypothetical protein
MEYENFGAVGCSLRKNRNSCFVAVLFQALTGTFRAARLLMEFKRSSRDARFAGRKLSKGAPL